MEVARLGERIDVLQGELKALHDEKKSMLKRYWLFSHLNSHWYSIYRKRSVKSKNR